MAKTFSKEAVAHFGNRYRTNVRPEHGRASRGGCMKAVYTGLGALYGDRYKFQGAFHKSFYADSKRLASRRGLSRPDRALNRIDRVFAALEKEGIAGSRTVYKPQTRGWRLADGGTATSLERHISNRVAGLPNGSYFFGASVNGGQHSLLLRLEKTESGTRVFWMDQFSDGYSAVRSGSFVRTPDVTGQLDAEIRRFGDRPTTVWQLLPDNAAGVLIPVDSDGDGILDRHAPAVLDATSHVHPDRDGAENGEYDEELGDYDDEDRNAYAEASGADDDEDELDTDTAFAEHKNSDPEEVDHGDEYLSDEDVHDVDGDDVYGTRGEDEPAIDRLNSEYKRDADEPDEYDERLAAGSGEQTSEPGEYEEDAGGYFGSFEIDDHVNDESGGEPSDYDEPVDNQRGQYPETDERGAADDDGEDVHG